MLLLRSLTQGIYGCNCWISAGTRCRFLRVPSPYGWCCLDSLSDKMTLLSFLSLPSLCQPVIALAYQIQHFLHEVFTEVCEILPHMLGMVSLCVSTWVFGLYKILMCEIWGLLHCFLLFTWKVLNFLCVGKWLGQEQCGSQHTELKLMRWSYL